MHGKISLESKLDVGTQATFWIPFRKAPYQIHESPLVAMGSIPDRLQSDLSVSRHDSEHSGPSTPTTPFRPGHQRGNSGSGLPALPVQDTQGHLSETERSDINVLIVEDNAINQHIALKTIAKLGFSARAVWNGKEALDYLRSPSAVQPRPDIVLMDVCQNDERKGISRFETVLQISSIPCSTSTCQ